MTGKDIGKLWFDGRKYFRIVAVVGNSVCLIPVIPILHFEPCAERQWVRNEMLSPSGSINITLEYKQ